MFCSFWSCPKAGRPTSCRDTTCSENTLGAGSTSFLVVGSAAAAGIGLKPPPPEEDEDIAVVEVRLVELGSF